MRRESHAPQSRTHEQRYRLRNRRQSVVAAALNSPPLRLLDGRRIVNAGRINPLAARLTFGLRRCTRCTLDDEDAGLHPTQLEGRCHGSKNWESLSWPAGCSTPHPIAASSRRFPVLLSNARAFRRFQIGRDRNGSRSSHCVTKDRCAGGRRSRPLRSMSVVRKLDRDGTRAPHQLQQSAVQGLSTA